VNGMQIREGKNRGRSASDWLVSRHALSFGDYDDPNYRNFHQMRVLNDDVIAPGAGFAPHGHEDVEIVSYIVRGRLEHGDDEGAHGFLETGDVQRITAGSGITHEERNASESEPLRLIQMWFMVRESGLEPDYERASFPREDRQNRWQLFVSPSGAGDSVSIRSDVEIYGGVFDAGRRSSFEVDDGAGLWLHVVRGEVKVADHPVAQGDGLLVEGRARLPIRAETRAELLAVETS